MSSTYCTFNKTVSLEPSHTPTHTLHHDHPNTCYCTHNYRQSDTHEFIRTHANTFRYTHPQTIIHIVVHVNRVMYTNSNTDTPTPTNSQVNINVHACIDRHTQTLNTRTSICKYTHKCRQTSIYRHLLTNMHIDICKNAPTSTDRHSYRN